MLVRPTSYFRIALGAITLLCGAVITYGEATDPNGSLVRILISVASIVGLAIWMMAGAFDRPSTDDDAPPPDLLTDALIGLILLGGIAYFAIVRGPNLKANLFATALIGLGLTSAIWGLVLIARYFLFRRADASFHKVSSTWEIVRDRERRVGYDGLSLPQKVYFAVTALDDEVMTGGFRRYFEGPYGNRAAEASVALSVIDATNQASVVLKAIAAFGPTGPPNDDTERRNQLDALAEFLFQMDVEYRDHVHVVQGRLNDYAFSHAKHFQPVPDDDDAT